MSVLIYDIGWLRLKEKCRVAHGGGLKISIHAVYLNFKVKFLKTIKCWYIWDIDTLQTIAYIKKCKKIIELK